MPVLSRENISYLLVLLDNEIDDDDHGHVRILLVMAMLVKMIVIVKVMMKRRIQGITCIKTNITLVT